MVFVTGPYGSNNIATSTGATATTLKATGQLITGTVNYSNIIDTKHTLIGNPYASALTPSTLLDGGTNLITNFWVWDPNVGTTGGYNMYDDVLNQYSSNTGSIQPIQQRYKVVKHFLYELLQAIQEALVL